MDETPASYHFEPGSTWEIADGAPPYVVVLAAVSFANKVWQLDFD
jgi:hypothetical protein